MALAMVPYMTIIAAFGWWNGIWCPPARYPSTYVPLAAAPLAMSLFALSKSWLYKALYALLALPGFFFMAIFMYDPRRLWPGNALLTWPNEFPGAMESPFRVNLRRYIPLFTPPDDVYHPTATATVVAFSILVVLACYFLMTRLDQFKSKRRWPYAMHGLVWLAALSLVGGGWYGMNLDYLKRKTVLTQVQRWNLDPPVNQPRGITYYDGKVYITGYESQTVGALDTATGSYTLIQPRSGQEQLRFSYPGDVKVGPDGLLYVLNNSREPHTMFAMRPDGEVVRRVPLDQKSFIAVGLQFGGDGKMYVADMIGGQIRKYNPQGGTQLGTLPGLTGGYNNVWGLVVDKDGTVYAAESSAKRVQVLDTNGRFIRSYDLQCDPLYLAQNGDWLDLSCGKRILSINKRDHQIQWAQVGDYTPEVRAPTGMTYGPDGTLYVVDGSALVAYKVEH